LACDVSHSRPQDASTMVELGKQLLHSAKNGDTEAVRELMCRGAPFTTDWVCALLFKKYLHFVDFICKDRHNICACYLAWYKCAPSRRTKQSYRDC